MQLPSPSRNLAFDIARGWLILFVILGHLVLGSIHDQPIRYAIYSFHMPLFIVITGFLVNRAKLRDIPIWQSAWRYWQRMALPFIPAYVFFTGTLVLHALLESRLSVDLLVAYITTPYYHLWFVPTVLIWVGLLCLQLKASMSLWLVLLMTLPLPIAWASLHEGPLPAVLLDKKVFFYAFFFWFGLVLSQYQNRWLKTLKKCFKRLISVVIILAIIVFTGVGREPNIYSALIWFVFNCSLALAILAWCLGNKKSNAHSVERLDAKLGRLSLPIYLWHVLPLFILKGFGVHLSQPEVYYLLSLLFMAILIVVVIRLDRHGGWLGKWFYGKPNVDAVGLK